MTGSSKKIGASDYLIKLIQDCRNKPLLHVGEIEEDLKYLLALIKNLEHHYDAVAKALRNL